ncbi:MAG: hypothetical protein ACK4N5_09135 [Myxococcales bacterium]
MTLELSTEEARELRNALDLYLGELHDEIHHSYDRQFRARLREVQDRLGRIAKRLEVQEAGGEMYA